MMFTAQRRTRFTPGCFASERWMPSDRNHWWDSSEYATANLNSQAVLVNVLFKHQVRRMSNRPKPTAPASAKPAEEGTDRRGEILAALASLDSSFKTIEAGFHANIDALSKELR